MAAGVNPLISQGLLNKVYTSVVVPGNLALNVTASFMAKSQVQVTFDDPFVTQPGTATGVVQCPQPYVGATCVLNLLRSQATSGLWLTQTQANAVLGDVSIYPDSNVYPVITLSSCAIEGVDPGAFDAGDPTVKITIKGIYETNAELWSNSITA